MDIKITKTENPKTKPTENLGFGKLFSDQLGAAADQRCDQFGACPCGRCRFRASVQKLSLLQGRQGG